jgi:hypothetical protein
LTGICVIDIEKPWDRDSITLPLNKTPKSKEAI